MPQRRTTPRPGARVSERPRSPRGRARLVLTASVLAGAVLVGGAGPAVAVPPPPPNPTDEQLGSARSSKEVAAAEVGRIAALVATAEAELQRLAFLAEAAGSAYLAAEEALEAAQTVADETASRLSVAAEAVGAAELRIADFSRDSYMNNNSLAASAALLDAAGPGELIQRAAMLDYVADNQVDVLGELEVARVQQANADSAAREARDEMAEAEAAAEQAKAEADRQVTAQQGAYEQAEAEKARYDAELRDAQVALLELEGARDAYQAWEQQKAAEEARKRAEEERRRAAAAEAARKARELASRPPASGGGGSGGGGSGGGGSTGGGGAYVRPTGGWISSCYGWRWGALHGGVDIAAPIGTPVYAAHSGVIQRSGPATGFGQALYLRGDDGAVTVYGHINRDYVSTGERVVAGQVIAEVGNRGQSTGPHLHFEVHPNGAMHSGRVDPVAWLRARGVSMEAC